MVLYAAAALCLLLAGCSRPHCVIYDGVCNPFVSMLLYSRATAARFVAVSNSTSSTISVYRMSYNSGALTQVSGSPFSGVNAPRHMAAHPSGRFLYAGINNTPNGRVAAYTISPDGSLAAVSGSPFVCGDDTIAVAVDPYTRFVYVAKSGDATGSSAVSAYTIGPAGSLTAIAGSPFAGGIQPIGVSVDPYGKFVFLSNTGSNNVTVHNINQFTGALTVLSTFSAGSGPFGVAFVPGLQF